MPQPSVYEPLSRTWAKLEIFFGLTTAGIGLLLGGWTTAHSEPERLPFFFAGALALFVLGGYLALAGNRSHLYQSLNEQTTLLRELVQREKNNI